jgi:hypothetical protein
MTAPTEWLTPEQKLAYAAQCNSQSCQDANTRLLNARNAFPSICADIKVWDTWRAAYAAMAVIAFAAAAYAAIASATATATIIGIPLGIVLAVAAVVFLAAALLFSALAVNAALQYGEAQKRRQAAETEFSAALADARTKCGPYCNIGDQKMPSC